MQYQPSQNTGNSGGLVLLEEPKRIRKKLKLSSHRLSRKRLAKRLRQCRLQKAAALKADQEAAQQATAENPPPTPAFNEQQCNIENNVAREETVGTEEDIAGSVSVTFNVLDGTYTIKDQDADGNKQQLQLLCQRPNVASDEVNAEAWPLGSSQVAKTQGEELFTVPVVPPLYYIKKIEDTDEMKPADVKPFTYLKKIINADKLGCGVLKADPVEQLTPLKKIEEPKAEPAEEDYYVVEKASKTETRKPFLSDKLCIVDMGYMFEQIKKAMKHSNGAICSLENLEVFDMTRSGMKNTLVLLCNMCNYKINIYSTPADHRKLDLNHSAALGTIATGGGFAQMEQFLAAMNVSTMSMKSYAQYSENVQDALMHAAEIEMLVAAEEEKKLAIERGDVLPCGTPFIPVVADGSWMKRSYGTGRFDSPSGCGVIIGLHSQKVLFIGVRNKVCSLCNYAARTKTPPREHRCFKNWGNDEPSTKMESDAILEGFMTSLATRGLIYSTLIADGDSSSYRRILDSDPYPGKVRVAKIECSNHLMRNFCKKMRELVKKTGRNKHRKTVEASITKMRTAITCAAKYRRQENVPASEQSENLKMDILNVPSHIFGEHKECKKIAYFCDGTTKRKEQNIIPELMELGVYQRIQEIIQPLLNHTQSLLLNRTNNVVESFNSLIAKYIGAKRINFSTRGSYAARCSAAVVQFNTKQLFSRVHKAMKKEPSSVIRGMENRKQRESTNKKIRSSITPRHVRKLIFPEDDPDYGPNALQPDIEQLPVQPEEEAESDMFESQNCSQNSTLPECVDDAEENNEVDILFSQDTDYGMEMEVESEIICESQSYSESQILMECLDDDDLPQGITYQILTPVDMNECYL